MSQTAERLLQGFIFEKLGGDRVDQCTARFTATGAIMQFQEFLVAEAARGTKPSDLLLAVSSIQAGILTATMALCFKEEARLTATDLFLDLLCKQIRAGMIEEGAKK